MLARGCLNTLWAPGWQQAGCTPCQLGGVMSVLLCQLCIDPLCRPPPFPARYCSVFCTHFCIRSPLEPLAQQLVETALPRKWGQQMEEQQATKQAAVGLLGLAARPSGQPSAGQQKPVEAAAEGGKQQQWEGADQQRQAEEQAEAERQRKEAEAAAAALLEEEERQAEKQAGCGGGGAIVLQPQMRLGPAMLRAQPQNRVCHSHLLAAL